MKPLLCAFLFYKVAFENSEVKLFSMGYWEPCVKGAGTSILFILIQDDSHCDM